MFKQATCSPELYGDTLPHLLHFIIVCSAPFSRLSYAKHKEVEERLIAAKKC